MGVRRMVDRGGVGAGLKVLLLCLSLAVVGSSCAHMEEDLGLGASSDTDIHFVEGFRYRQPVRCPPVPAGRVCMKINDPLEELCTKASGEVRFCEDCMRICSKPVTSAAGQ